MDVVAKLKLGNRHHQAGRLTAAAEVYAEVLHNAPDQPDALHLSGLLAHQQGKSEDAVRLIERAVAIDPSHIGYLKNLCTVLMKTGLFDKATDSIERTLAISPDCVQLWFDLGNCRQNLGQFEQAVQVYEKLLSLQADHVNGIHNLGTALHALEEYDEAIACYDRALRLKPQFPEAWYNMGNSLLAIGAMEEAIDAMQKALSIRPDYSDARFNLAKLYKETGQLETALSCYSEILKFSPGNAEVYNNLGNLFLDLGRPDEAGGFYRQALEIVPDHPEALVNLSLSFQDKRDLQAAMVYSRRAVEINPEYDFAVSTLVHQQREGCEWENLKELDACLDELTGKALAEHRRPAEGPFLNLSRHVQPALNLEVAQAWSRDLADNIRPAGQRQGQKDAKRDTVLGPDVELTIGYLSNNFRNHPTAQLLSAVIGLHNRKQFRVHCYSYGRDDGSVYRAQIKREADRFIELQHLDDRRASALIQEHQVDILIDLTGYMKGHRMGICARRPAPVQVRYLGQAGTSGADFFDYLIADAMVVPAAHQPYYTEQLVYLPHSYQVNSHRHFPVEGTPCREDCGLPVNGVVLGAFSSHYKLDPQLFSSWMKILSAVSDSVLWMISGSDIVERNLRQCTTSHGIDPDRVIFAARLPKEQHLARLDLADIALDTWLVGGAATTSDALWAGVPVITRIGGHFASRMSASLLHAVGLPELVSQSADAYVSLAIDLARHPAQRQALREKLAVQKMIAPLFDTSRTVRSLESAFLKMWNNYETGRSPQSITVDESHHQNDASPIQRGQ